MPQFLVLTGYDVRGMFSAGTLWLEKNAADIDAINVFPVPDGDTGTNMLLTMRSSMEEASRTTDGDASAVMRAMAYGALMGARGNSGVILSQILRGLASALDGKESVSGSDLAVALFEASQLAYKGLSHPVEGTILTVARDIAEAAKVSADNSPDNVITVIESSVAAARDSVLRTPSLLATLREAGVVDAGAEGLYTILEGALRYLKGEEGQIPNRTSRVVASYQSIAPRFAQLPNREEPYGYCTEFLIEGRSLSTSEIEKRLRRKGKSLIVVGDENHARVHIHTLTPGTILTYATLLGVLHDIKIQNMDDQHRRFIELQKSRQPSMDTALVSVVAGDGMKEIFRSLGTTSIVSGGQTMNPSVRELLHTIQAVSSEKVILLPNNKNIVMAASQVPQLTDKKVGIIPSVTMAQGVAAILAFVPGGDYEANIGVMTEALDSIRTIEITTAVRDTLVNGLAIKARQAIAIVDGQDIVAASDDTFSVVLQALARLPMENVELVTTYFGEETQESEAASLCSLIRQHYSGKRVEVFKGGQPNYRYMISIE